MPLRQSRTAVSSQPASERAVRTCARRRHIFRCSFSAAVLWLVTPSRAHAYEDQQTLALGFGYAQLVSRTPPAHGVCVDLSASSGLSPAWTARARLTYGLHPAPEPLHVGIVAAELVYVIDIFEFVPYFGAGAAGVGHVRVNTVTAYPAVHAVAGLDYLLSRALAIELDVRAQLLLTALQTHPLYVAATLSMVLMLDQ